VWQFIEPDKLRFGRHTGARYRGTRERWPRSENPTRTEGELRCWASVRMFQLAVSFDLGVNEEGRGAALGHAPPWGDSRRSTTDNL